ncbi:MAG: hypothetical protein FWF95_00595 [Syntrophorhabdaceae bacterium]|nr:hypothetical protein [Syntrophorhabdaceae bacterium]
MRNIFLAALLMVMFLPTSDAAQDAAKTESEWYVNMKYGFSVEYQKKFFLPQGEKTDGSGQNFRSMDGKAIVSVYGYDANEYPSLTSVFNETLQNLSNEGWKVVHKSIKGDTFILQGTRETVIFYKKIVYNNKSRQFVNFEAVYDATKSKFYETAISSMAGSLKMLHIAGAGR